MRKRPLGLAFLLAVSAFGPLSSVRADDACRDVAMPVTLSQQDTTPYTVAGTFCAPGPLEDATVHLLLSGGSYGRVYWDFPYEPERYSYVRAASGAGIATLNLDRIGIGASGKPPAEQVTIESNAFVVHQVVQALRDGSLLGARVPRVVLVGHSLGTGVAWVEAAVHQDVDGLIATGAMHTPSWGLGLALATFYPAQADPRFAGGDLPLGYLTTLPGTRGLAFYDAAHADPEVIATDEDTKETATVAELITLAGSADPEISRSIKIPVLVVVGDHDHNFCVVACSGDPATMLESSYYAPEAGMELYLLPESGHDVNLHLRAPEWYAVAMSWSDRLE